MPICGIVLLIWKDAHVSARKYNGTRPAALTAGTPDRYPRPSNFPLFDSYSAQMDLLYR